MIVVSIKEEKIIDKIEQIYIVSFQHLLLSLLYKAFAYFYSLKIRDIDFMQWDFNQISAKTALDYIAESMNTVLRFQQIVAL